MLVDSFPADKGLVCLDLRTRDLLTLTPDFPRFSFRLDLDARPWDFQAEECALRSAVDRFNSRRYDKNSAGYPVNLGIDLSV
jgi:Domain of unknown function (DUF3402)